jgi:multidrug efflux pump subunit AcrA (membrane-fusion protein)
MKFFTKKRVLVAGAAAFAYANRGHEAKTPPPKYRASLASAQASLRLAQASFERNQQLVAKNFVSSLALDQSRRELDVAQANRQLAEAQLARALADLNNSVIRSPIDGVVIKRTIDLGQTMAAGKVTGAAREPAKAAVAPPEDDLARQDTGETARMFKVYKLDARNQPQPVDIRIGLSNFRYTEVVSGDLKAGERVVTRSLTPTQGM